MIKKLRNTIFDTIFLITLVCILLVVLTSFFFLNNYFTKVVKDELRSQTGMLAAATEELGLPFLESLDEDFRITWIKSDGEVIFDSYADSAEMENHLDREEIKEAISYGRGSSTRHSATLSEKTLYEAIRLSDGSVLRLAFTSQSVLSLSSGLIPYLVLAVILALVVCSSLSAALTRRIIRPLNKTSFNKPLESEAYEELSPLLVRIDIQNREIDSQLKELERKREEFDAVTDNMSECLILLDSSLSILTLNRAAKKLFETTDNAIGRSILTLERSLEFQKLLKTVREEGKGSLMLRKSGRIFEAGGTLIKEGGNSRGICLLLVDKTEKVGAEEMRREFSANVSHELKTPLHSILGYSELLKNNMVKDGDRELFISRIHSEASRLVTLIDDIIRLSQLDEGGALQAEEVNLQLLVQDTVDSLEREAEEKHVALSSESEPLIIKAPLRLVSETLYNLADNAVRYNRDGGKVEISVKREENVVRIKVSDNGIGIPEEDKERIFERFYRVDKSHSKETGGTGLGLSIVKHAVSYLGGEIKVESVLGKGTAMIIDLPSTLLI